jgi:hypothetical protein
MEEVVDAPFPAATRVLGTRTSVLLMVVESVVNLTAVTSRLWEVPVYALLMAVVAAASWMVVISRRSRLPDSASSMGGGRNAHILVAKRLHEAAPISVHQ